MSVTNQVMSLVLAKDKNIVKKLIHIMSKVFKGGESRFQNIERLSIAFMITPRKLIHYSQRNHVMVKTIYHIQQVLENPDLAERIVS